MQANPFSALPSVTVLRLTSAIGSGHLVRITVQPTPENGLWSVSQIMIDKAVSVPREKIGMVFGNLDDGLMLAVSKALVAFLGLQGAAA